MGNVVKHRVIIIQIYILYCSGEGKASSLLLESSLKNQLIKKQIKKRKSIQVYYYHAHGKNYRGCPVAQWDMDGDTPYFLGEREMGTVDDFWEIVNDF